MDIPTVINLGVIYLLIFGIIATIFFYILYNHVIAKFSKNYDNFIKILRNVKDNDMNFMNFGYWDEKDINLTEANRRLCDFVIDKADIKNKNILCIGDNLNTDIKGANVQNFKSLFIMNGIHKNENNIDELKKEYDVDIDYTQKSLVW